MSTKIPHGRRIPKSEFWSFLHAVSHELSVTATKLERSKIAEIAVAAIDDAACDKPVTWLSTSPWHHAYEEVKEHAQKIKDTCLRDPAYDFDYAILMAEFDRWVFILPQVEHEPFMRIIKKHSQAYEYWNNTDRLSSVSQREWDQRGKEWDIACDNPQVTHRRGQYDYLKSAEPQYPSCQLSSSVSSELLSTLCAQKHFQCSRKACKVRK